MLKRTLIASISAGIALAALCCLPACGERQVPAETAAEQGVLLLNNGGEPSALDPQFAQPGVIENRIMLALFEGLVRYDPKTLEPIPAIAESWSVSEDGLRWTFRLRADAKFSDGKNIVADDFLFSFRRILSPKLASPCASLFFAPVKNARAFATGTLNDFSQVGFSAPDPHTLVVELENPCPYFLALACHSSWSVVPAHAILRFGEIDSRSTLWTRPENFVGSGPFRLRSWRVAYRIEAEKNPLYWDARNVTLNGIRFDAVEDQFAEETAFNDGQYHITNTVPPSRVPVLREQNAPALRLDPYLSTAFIRINCAKPPLNDPRVRRALSLAIDRTALAERVMRGGETPAYSLVPADAYAASGARSANTLPESPADRDAAIREARALLAQAGFPDGKGFPEIAYTRFTVSASPKATTNSPVPLGAAITSTRPPSWNYSSPADTSIGRIGATPATTVCSPKPHANATRPAERKNSKLRKKSFWKPPQSSRPCTRVANSSSAPKSEAGIRTFSTSIRTTPSGWSPPPDSKHLPSAMPKTPKKVKCRGTGCPRTATLRFMGCQCTFGTHFANAHNQFTTGFSSNCHRIVTKCTFFEKI